jgi:uncharacterized protein (TIGR03067 family)
MIYRIATGQGLLVIESQDANVRVLVLKEGREVKIVDSKNNAIHVKAGQYELQLVDDNANVRLEKQTVVLSSGAKEIVRVVNQPNDTNNAKGDVAKNPTNTFPTGPHKIQPGDILGIFIEGIIGDYRKSPPIHYPSPDSGLPPTMGYPVFVDEKGELSLPLADPIKLSGRTLSEAQSIITNVYVRDKILSSDQSKILVSLLRRRSELTCSPAYQAKPGTVLGVFVEGILGQQGEMPPIHFPDRTTGLPPAVGYPIVVNDTGNVSLPLVDPIPVSGKTISDIRRAITQTYEGTLLKPGRSRILVALIRPHDYKAPYQKTIANSGFNRRDERTRKTMPVDPNWIHVDPEPQNSADWAPRTVPPVKTPSLPSPILGYWKIVGLTNRQEKVDSLHEDSQVVITENKMLFLEKGQLESEGNIEIKATRSFDRIRFSTSDFTSLGILQLTGDYLKIAFNPPGDEEYPANFDAGELRTYMLLRERNKSKIASDDPKATPNSTAWPGQKKNSALDRDSMLEQIDDYETVLKRSVSKLRIQLLAVRNQDHGPRQTEIESAITNITGYAPIHIDSLSIALSSNEDKLAVEVSDRWVPVISKPVQEQLDLTDNNYTTRWNGSDIEVLRENPQTELEQALLAGFPAVATISVDKSVASVDLSIPDEAAQHLNSLTRENIGNYLVVMINKRVVMVPRIRSAVDNDIRLSGKYTLEQLQTMLKPQPQP